MRMYSAAERAAGVALAATIGPKMAAKQLGYPVTTVVYWMHKPAASPIIAAAEASAMRDCVNPNLSSLTKRKCGDSLPLFQCA